MLDGHLALQLSRAIYTETHTEFPTRMSLPNNLTTEAIFMFFFFPQKTSVLRKAVKELFLYNSNKRTVE